MSFPEGTVPTTAAVRRSYSGAPILAFAAVRRLWSIAPAIADERPTLRTAAA